ncbi:hypothetical protein EDB92DRAFT_633942 [Lactarius akahatsu]|uniref:Uncharacterized protein n=1 Tax=Lactarius akahatsu TaxID=416441 RepID=A0AAD4Q7D6_9AGAM|nr:hypothetical protein EDB92DRAFT_633942 [Lactarius akahatsu]
MYEPMRIMHLTSQDAANWNSWWSYRRLFQYADPAASGSITRVCAVHMRRNQAIGFNKGHFRAFETAKQTASVHLACMHGDTVVLRWRSWRSRRLSQKDNEHCQRLHSYLLDICCLILLSSCIGGQREAVLTESVRPLVDPCSRSVLLHVFLSLTPPILPRTRRLMYIVPRKKNRESSHSILCALCRGNGNRETAEILFHILFKLKLQNTNSYYSALSHYLTFERM